MRKYIVAIFVLLVLIGIVAFSPINWVRTESESAVEPTLGTSTTPLVSLRLPNLALSLPFLGDSSIKKAWETFEEYLAAAKAHDIETVKRLSYKLSDACLDPKQEAECFSRMDSVYLLAGEFKFEDFKYNWVDDKQAILSTDYSQDGAKVVLFFTRENSHFKLLSMDFCFAGAEQEECKNDGQVVTDSDGDGWWDITERFFSE